MILYLPPIEVFGDVLYTLELGEFVFEFAADLDKKAEERMENKLERLFLIMFFHT